MSADNWAACPKCNEVLDNKIKKMEKDLTDSYGKVDEAEYLAKKVNLQEMKDSDNIKYTLRENYEIGIYEGKFCVEYGASCEVCGFSLEHYLTTELGVKDE